jgi:acetoacetyl-CoA synthetase
VDESLPIDRVPRWFEGVQLNFAENVLYTRSVPASRAGLVTTTTTTTSRRGTQNKDDARIAVTEIREGGSATQHVNWADLRSRVGRLAAALRRAGVREGDRVVVVGANSVHTLLVFLATCWLGAIFSSSSTDMGVQGILQRTVQVNPKVSHYQEAIEE